VPTQQVEGTVEATNRTGIRIGGAWLNVSQFHPVELPEQGAHVRLEVDSKGFIKDLEVLKTAGVETASVSREDRIARLAVLRSAATFLGELSHTREEVRSDHVLLLADKWLAWVNQ
jgi:hypothetical protein